MKWHSDRNISIFTRAINGHTFTKIADEENLTKQRVWQIIDTVRIGIIKTSGGTGEHQRELRIATNRISGLRVHKELFMKAIDLMKGSNIETKRPPQSQVDRQMEGWK